MDKHRVPLTSTPSMTVNLNKAIRKTTLRPEIDQLSDQSVGLELTVPSGDTNERQRARDEAQGEQHYHHQQQRAPQLSHQPSRSYRMDKTSHTL